MNLVETCNDYERGTAPFADVIKAALEHYSQADLANRCFVGPSVITRWAQGEEPMRRGRDAIVRDLKRAAVARVPTPAQEAQG